MYFNLLLEVGAVEAAATKGEGVHTHSPVYAALDENKPRGHQQQGPASYPQNQPLPGLVPSRPVVHKGWKLPLLFVLLRVL